MESASLLSHTYPLTQGQQQRQHLPLVPQQGQPAPGNYDQQQSGGQPAIAMLQPANVVDSNSTTTSMVGQKRNFSGNTVNSNVPDAQDGGNFVKLFVGSVPRTISEEEVRPMFAEHGNVLEVALIKDKRTGQQQGCCFVKYGTIAEAERAIRALNNQRTLPGGTAPVQVRYADGERERLGAVEHKLFVGSLNKQASEKEIQELFAPYGRVDDVYIMRDEQKQSRGCAFIKYPTREMATAAINALNGTYVMPGCDQPLAVRFADPKRPKGGDTRVGGPGFGGPGYNSRPGSVGNRLAPAPVGPMSSRGPPIGWRPMGGPGMGPQPQLGPGGYGGPFGLRANSGSVPMGYYQQGVQRQPHPYGQPVSQQQQPYGQAAASPQQQSSQQVLSMPSQPPQHLQLSQGQVTTQQLPLQQQMQPSRQLQPPQQQLQPPQQQLQPPQQQLQPQLQPQQQSQSILQAHPQHQQQTPQQQQAAGMKPGYYPLSSIQQGQQQPQPSWVIPAPQQTVSALGPAPTPPASCDWTEHTSPEGYKYYHNSSTGESKWEKPEELVAFEQQQTAQVQAQAVAPTQYSGTTVIPQHLIQTLNYPQLQITNGSVDQPRQQVQPSMQDWAWKQKAAGAGNLG